MTMTLSSLIRSQIGHVALTVVCTCGGWNITAADAQGPAGANSPARISRVDPSAPAWRVPVDVVWWNDCIATGNSRTGTVSLITHSDAHALDVHRVDGEEAPEQGRSSSLCVESEWKVGASLSALGVAAGYLLVLDDQSNQVNVVARSQDASQRSDCPPSHSDIHSEVSVAAAAQSLLVTSVLDVPRQPVEISVAQDNVTFAVASLWARVVTLARVSENGEITEVRQKELPFAPRTMLFLTNERLVVADGFGGQLIVLDVPALQIVHSRSVPGHNIRGLSLDADGSTLLLSHQTLDGAAYTSYEQVFWGVVMRNGLQSMPVDLLLNRGRRVQGQGSADRTGIPEPSQREITDDHHVNLAHLDNGGEGSVASESGGTTGHRSADIGGATYDHADIYPLGTPSVGSGDPGQILTAPDGTMLVLLSGVNQVAIRRGSHLPFARLSTGRRPEAVCFDEAQNLAFVANRFDDSLSVIDVAIQKVICTLPLGRQRPLTEAEEGERSFYDATLSLDGWFSCHSCHTDGHTNGLVSDTLGDEGQGAPKKVLSLLGVSDTGPWAWNGGKASLEEQIRTSLIVSMQSQVADQDLPVSALTQYVRTLQPPPGVMAARGAPSDTSLTDRGRELFREEGCMNCHSGSSLTSDGVYDVGLEDETGNRRFNPPSLRGVSQRTNFFHDGRAPTLRDVLHSEHHDSQRALTEDEMDALESFLNTL